MTTTTVKTLRDLAAELADAEYGAPTTAEYEGATYRAKVEPDEDTSVFDNGDWAGEFAWVKTDRWTGRDETRPAGFDGAARKLSVGRSADRIWWQPPACVPADKLDGFASTIVDLIEYGYVTVIVERLDGTDAYGAPVVVDFASLGGIDSLGNGYGAVVIEDLLGEVLPDPASEG